MNRIVFERGGFPVISKILFDNLMNETWNNDMLKMKTNYPMNIIQNLKDGKVINYRLEFAFAGFHKDEISVEVRENIMKISAEKKEEILEEGQEEIYLRQGLSYKDFEVSYQLMDEIDKEKIKVYFEDGILSIILSIKQEEEKSYKIEIE